MKKSLSLPNLASLLFLLLLFSTLPIPTRAGVEAKGAVGPTAFPQQAAPAQPAAVPSWGEPAGKSPPGIGSSSLSTRATAAPPISPTRPFPSGGRPAGLDPANLPGLTHSTPPLSDTLPTDWWGAVQQDILASEYEITWQQQTCLDDVEAAYQAPNRAHNLRTYLIPQGIVVIPRVWPQEEDAPPWRLGLELAGAGPAELQAEGNRLTYQREGLREWYVNDEQGIQQGFSINPLPSSWPPGQLVLTISGNLTPTLVDDGTTVEFFTPAGVRALRYEIVQAHDAAGNDLPVQISLSPGRLVFSLDASKAAAPLTIITALMSGPDWGVLGQQDGEFLGWSVSTAGDVNNDGYDDIIIGAPGYDNGQTDEGLVYVFHGHWTGLSFSPDWITESNRAYAEFGTAVGTAGDVDGDGYDEVIVGAPYYSNGQDDEGAAFVYHGSAAGLATSPEWQVEGEHIEDHLGWSVSTAGDVNSDSYADVIVGVPDCDDYGWDVGQVLVYHGSSAGLSSTPNWTIVGESYYAYLGRSVGTAGDVNGDTYADVIIGAPGDGYNGEGWAYAYHGSASGLEPLPAWYDYGSNDYAQFGHSVSTAGDVNGDGYADVIVGAPYYGGDYGRAWVYHGSNTGLSFAADWVGEDNQYESRFGYAVGTAGDANGDGYDDVLVGAPWFDSSTENEGRLYYYPGSAGGLPENPGWTYEGNETVGFAWSLGPAGDVNGDGYSDIIAGAPYDSSPFYEGGVAYVFYGGEWDLLTPPAWTSPISQVGSDFGFSVSTAGDVNGDGYSDFVVGAPEYDSGQSNEGRAFVYHGSADGPDAMADWTVESDQAGARLGSAVRIAGDVNGDGYADLIVGAPDYDNGENNEGAAFVYLGSTAGLSSTAAWSIEGNQDEARFGQAVGTAGDVDGDGFAEVIVGAPYYDNGEADEGAAFVYLGAAAGLSTTAAWVGEGDQAGARYGWVVDTAGDVNADTYDDVVVGADLYDNSGANGGRVYLYHGSAGGLSGGYDWTAGSDQANAHYGRSLGPAGDVNGDGYSDLIVGAPDFDNGDTNEGRVYLYHGSAAGLTAPAAWRVESDHRETRLGYAVSPAGDLNGDGYADVVISAYGEERVYGYYGSAGGLSAVEGWVAQSNNPGRDFGQALSTAGDVNGDGFSDVLIAEPDRVHLYYGAAERMNPSYGWYPSHSWFAQSNQGGAHLGWSVSTAGDVNGDGYADVIVGAPDYDNGQSNEGRAFVWYGAPDGLGANGNPGNADWLAEGEQANAHFGFSVSTAGDVNGDGYDEVIVGAPDYDNGENNEGQARLYYGSSLGLNPAATWATEGDQAQANFGNSVSTAGDVNGDGFADVMVGAPYYDNGQNDEGGMFVYYGAAGGISTTANWLAEPDSAGAYCGWAVSTAGDVNGDGYSDAIIGCLSVAAIAYYGSAAGLSTTMDWWAFGSGSPYFGISVDTAGDVNGDGYSDVIVGDSTYEDGEQFEGRALLYYGSAAGLSTDPDWTVEGNQETAFFGQSVSTAGDVNGDGYADILVGAPWYEMFQWRIGKAYLYYGSPTGPGTVADWTATGDFVDGSYGAAVNAAGDVNGDGYADVIVGESDGEKTFVYYGNGDDNLEPLPRQVRSGSSAPIALGGLSDAARDIRLQLTGQMPLGREPVQLQWQIAPLGTPFTATSGVISGATAWTDVLTQGVVISGSVSGLTPRTPYHWRARLGYPPGNRLGQPAGRWIHIPWNGWSELDLRTPDEPIAGLLAANDSPTTLGQPTTLSATISSGSNVSYSWALGDGMLAEGALVGHVYPAVGVHTATVTASNSVSLLTATTIVTITDVPISGLQAFNSSPTALGDPTRLTATISAGSSVSYTWSLGDGSPPQAAGENISHTYPAAGAYTALVTASNNVSLLTATTIVTIEEAIIGLSASNDSPTALGQPTILTATISAGSNVQYAWALGDGTVGYGAVLSHTYPAAGVFTALVTASNSVSALTATTLVTVTNEPPIAHAGPDQGVLVETLVALDGSASSDPDGHLPLRYGWTQTAGTPVILSSAAISRPTFTAPLTPTVLGFALAVTDAAGLPDPSPDSVVITVSDVPLAGLVATNDSPTTLGRPTTLTATISAGSNAQYAWALGDGTAGDGAVLSHTYPAAGVFAAVVTASNGAGALTATTQVTITNEPPIAHAGPDQGVLVETLVALDGSASSDPDGHLPLRYGWTQTAGTPVILSSAAISRPTFTAPLTPTVLGFALTVTDAAGLPDPSPDNVVITVSDVPLAGLLATSDSPTTLGRPTTLTATIDSGSNVQYAWALGDGTVGYGAVLSHTYPAAGVFAAIVTASNAGGSVVATTVVTVEEAIAGLFADNDGPTALGDVTMLTATITAGSNVSYTWDLGDGSYGTGAVISHTYPDIGVYTAVVTASNSVSVETQSTVVEIASTDFRIYLPLVLQGD